MSFRSHFIFFLYMTLVSPLAYSAYLKVEDDLMLDIKKISVIESSLTETPNIIGTLERSFIQISCEEQKLESYISTPTYNGSNNNVGLRWNSDKPIYKRWNESTSGTAFFAPNPRNFISKTQTLQKKKLRTSKTIKKNNKELRNTKQLRIKTKG